jgi:hypothetical protein
MPLNFAIVVNNFIDDFAILSRFDYTEFAMLERENKPA